MTDTRPIAAALSIVSAMAIIGFIDNFVVTIAEDAGVWQFHAIRTVISLPVFALIVALGWGRARPNRFWPVAGRSLFLTLAMILYFSALAVLPIAQAVAGLFTSPIFVVLISILVQRQPVGPVRLAAVAAGFLGILLVLRPDTSAFSVWTVVPVMAGFFYAISAVATRAWCQGEDALTMTLGSFLGLGIAGAIGLVVMTGLATDGSASFVLRGWEPPTARFLALTAMQAIGSIGAVFLIIRAYQLGEASYVGVFEYTLLVFVSAWAWVLRGEVVDATAALGMCLIAGAGAVIALRSRRDRQAARAVDVP